jgi:hypothetical protein
MGAARATPNTTRILGTAPLKPLSIMAMVILL